MTTYIVTCTMIKKGSNILFDQVYEQKYIIKADSKTNAKVSAFTKFNEEFSDEYDLIETEVKKKKLSLPTYMNDNAIAMDVFQVILDTLKVVPESLDQIKEFVDGI